MQSGLDDGANLKTRNKVLDLLRGHYLVAILIDHFNRFPSVYELYNAKGNLWVSAATGFVFMSGYLIGLVSLSKLQKHGFVFAANSLFKRGIKLYFVGVILTLLYSNIGLALGRWPDIGEGIKYSSFIDQLGQALLFNYSYGWADLLIFYSILILVSPLILWFLHKGHWTIVLLTSFLLWLYGIVTPGIQRVSASYFSLISWQFLFILGMLSAYHRVFISSLYRRLFVGGGNILAKLALVGVFLGSVVLSYLDVYRGVFGGVSKQIITFLFDKVELGPGRLLLFFVWFVFFYTLVLYIERPLSKYFGWIFLTFGRNSLLTYVVQSAVLFASFYVTVPYTSFHNFVYTTFALLVTVVLVKLIVWSGKAIGR